MLKHEMGICFGLSYVFFVGGSLRDLEEREGGVEGVCVCAYVQ